MSQQIRYRYKFSELEYFISGKKVFLSFLLVLCFSLLPVLVRAECVPYIGSVKCTTQGECSSILSGSSGEGIWDNNMPGQDCKCHWQNCNTYPCPYVVCVCCSYDISSCPSPSDPCCDKPDDPCCGHEDDPCCKDPTSCECRQHNKDSLGGEK